MSTGVAAPRGVELVEEPGAGVELAAGPCLPLGVAIAEDFLVLGEAEEPLVLGVLFTRDELEVELELELELELDGVDISSFPDEVDPSSFPSL